MYSTTNPTSSSHGLCSVYHIGPFPVSMEQCTPRNVCTMWHAGWYMDCLLCNGSSILGQFKWSTGSFCTSHGQVSRAHGISTVGCLPIPQAYKYHTWLLKLVSWVIDMCTLCVSMVHSKCTTGL